MMNDTFMKEKPVLPLILSMSLPMDVIHAKYPLRGCNKQKNITTAKSTGKTMTSGVITTRNMMKHPAM